MVPPECRVRGALWFKNTPSFLPSSSSRFLGRTPPTVPSSLTPRTCFSAVADLNPNHRGAPNRSGLSGPDDMVAYL